MKSGMLFKPGTVALAIFIAIVGYGTYNLVSNDVQDIGDSTSDQREQLLECSGLSIEFVQVEEKANSTTVTFRSNRDLNSVKVDFGDSNASGEVKNISSQQLNSFSAPVSNFSNIFLKADGCSQIFSRE